MKKYRQIIIGLIIGLGLVLLINGLGNSFNLSGGKIILITLVVGVILLLVGFIYNYKLMKKYNKRVMHQIELMNSSRANEALEDMKDMVNELDSKNLSNVSRFIKLNMSACYCELKQFDKSLETLLSLKDEKLSRDELLIYELNLCVTYFYLERFEEGLAEYEENKDFLNEFKDDPNYAANVCAVNVMALIAKKNYAEARSVLNHNREKWNTPRLASDFKTMDLFLRQFENKN